MIFPYLSDYDKKILDECKKYRDENYARNTEVIENGQSISNGIDPDQGSV
jgi:hypothetical protein